MLINKKYKGRRQDINVIWSVSKNGRPHRLERIRTTKERSRQMWNRSVKATLTKEEKYWSEAKEMAIVRRCGENLEKKI